MKNKNLLGFIGFIMLLALFTIALPKAHAVEVYNLDVYVGGKQVAFPDQKPYIDDTVNRTYVPVRFVSEALGCFVDWDGENQTATITKGSLRENIQINNKEIRVLDTITGKENIVVIDAPALLVNSRTMVPLRFVSEALNADVKWTAPTGTAKGRVDVNWKKETTPVSTNGLPPGLHGGEGKVIIAPNGGGMVNTTPAEESVIPWVTE